MNAAAAAATFLAAFALFCPALVIQIFGESRAPNWYPMMLRQRSDTPIVRIAATIWTGAWAIGGQLLVLVLLAKQLAAGSAVTATIFAIEVLVAVVFIRVAFGAGGK